MRIVIRFALPAVLTIVLASAVSAGGRREAAEPATGPAQAASPERTAGEPASTPADGVDPAPVSMDAATAEILFALGMMPFQNRIPAEDFIIPALGGGERTLSGYLGQLVFLNFWATWCPPCREEMPSMQTLHEELADEGLVILAVDVQEPEATVRAFVEEFGFTFPVLLDANGRVALRYSVRAFPTTYIVDRDGNVIAVRPGFHDWSTPEMIAGFRELLAQ